MVNKSNPPTSQEIAGNQLVPRLRWPSTWWPLILGVLCLLASTAIEDYKTTSHARSAQAAASGGVAEAVSNTGAAAGLRETGANEAPESLIFRAETLILLISETGYAFIIAWVVGYFIEAGARREQNEAFTESMSRISRNVFAGVFRLKHDPTYVQAVMKHCLEIDLIREGYSIIYTVDPFTADEEVAHGLDHGRFVRLTVESRYRARNVGSEKRTFNSAHVIPVRSGKLKALSELTELRLGSRIFKREEIPGLLSNEEANADDRFYAFDFEVDANDEIEIFLMATIVKEMSDSETFGFKYPTMDVRLRVNMNVAGMRFDASNRTVGEMKVLHSPQQGRIGEWKISDPVLPYNSVVVWWRSPEDDGSTAGIATAVAVPGGIEPGVSEPVA